LTIFGFNTDIRYGDTVYHVQTEAREAESLLQSALFVRGRCIGKHSVSYADEISSPEFSEEHVHGLLTRQHRFVVNSIREGKLDTILRSGGPPGVDSDHRAIKPSDARDQPGEGTAAPAATVAVQLASPAPVSPATPAAAAAVPPVSPVALEMEWLASECLVGSSHARLQFVLKSAGQAADGGRVLGRLDMSGAAAIYARSVSAQDGAAELNFTLPAFAKAAPEELILLVQATYKGASITRKFRLRRG
jgi:hypothetical protein